MCKAERVPEKHMLIDGWMDDYRQTGRVCPSEQRNAVQRSRAGLLFLSALSLPLLEAPQCSKEGRRECLIIQ